MGDAHTDLERESTREYEYRNYLQKLKIYLTNPTSNNKYRLMQNARGVDFVMLNYWMENFDYEKTLGKNIEQKIELLKNKDSKECKKFLDSIVWHQTNYEREEFKKILQIR